MTFMDDLRAVREGVLAQATKTLPVNGAGGRLAVRFRPPEDRERLTGVIGSYIARGELTPEQGEQLIIDCQGEVLRRNGSGELESYDPPLRFDGSDPRWELGENGNARQAVAKLFNLDVIPFAIAGVVDGLVDWLQGLDVRAAGVVEGESEGGAD